MEPLLKYDTGEKRVFYLLLSNSNEHKCKAMIPTHFFDDLFNSCVIIMFRMLQFRTRSAKRKYCGRSDHGEILCLVHFWQHDNKLWWILLKFDPENLLVDIWMY